VGAPVTAPAATSTPGAPSRVKGGALAVATLALLAVTLMPAPAGLSVAGQRVLAVLAFAIVVWITEAVSYPVSAALVVTLGALLVGAAPPYLPNATGAAIGTSKALGLFLEGFASPAAALVAAAVFLAAAMRHTRLDRRLALLVLRRTGTSPDGILVGAILVGIVLAFFVPSTTARVGAIVPIMSGMVAAFGLARDSRMAACLMITTAQVATIWNVAIKTAAAQNLLAVGLIQQALGVSVSWRTWFVNAAPWALVMTGVLYVVMRAVVPPERVGGPEARAEIAAQLSALGPVRAAEWRLIAVAVALLALWSTEGALHTLDTSTTTLAAVTLLLMPRVGVLAWEDAERLVPWGTVVLFAVGISLGSVLIATGAAAWTARATLGAFGVQALSPLAMVAVLSAVNVVVHLGFASATSLAATWIPIVLAFTAAMQRPDVPTLGMVLVQQFVVSFGFLLPVNSPQNMVAYGSGAFTTRDFLRTGVWITLVGYLLVLVLAATWWRWTGLL
jgi:sodium-dependent dicarboxylate transporter 2/3/5